MSLLKRKPLSIGRAQRALRDDRVFVVASDDTYAPEQYFEHLPLPRVRVIVVPTPVNSGESAPGHVVDRLKEAFANVSQRKQVQAGDEFWVLLDTDHHFRDNNVAATLEAIRTARQVGFEVAISNPCFELWLLLHHTDVARGTTFSKCGDVEQEIRRVLGQYNKTHIKPGQFPLARVANAIRRARALETVPEAAWPEQAGTQIYRLFERVLPPGP